MNQNICKNCGHEKEDHWMIPGERPCKVLDCSCKDFRPAPQELTALQTSDRGALVEKFKTHAVECLAGDTANKEEHEHLTSIAIEHFKGTGEAPKEKTERPICDECGHFADRIDICCSCTRCHILVTSTPRPARIEPVNLSIEGVPNENLDGIVMRRELIKKVNELCVAINKLNGHED